MDDAIGGQERSDSGTDRAEGGGPIPPSSIDRLLDQFEAGEFDIVAVGRALLADPGRVDRVRDGKLDEFGGFDAASALGRLY